jgi:hypothetical protein
MAKGLVPSGVHGRARVVTPRSHTHPRGHFRPLGRRHVHQHRSGWRRRVLDLRPWVQVRGIPHARRLMPRASPEHLPGRPRVDPRQGRCPGWRALLAAIPLQEPPPVIAPPPAVLSPSRTRASSPRSASTGQAVAFREGSTQPRVLLPRGGSSASTRIAPAYHLHRPSLPSPGQPTAASFVIAPGSRLRVRWPGPGSCTRRSCPRPLRVGGDAGRLISRRGAPAWP